MKKFFRLLCLAACVFCMTACASNKTTTTGIDESSYKAAVESDLLTLSTVSDAEILTALASYGSQMTETDIALFTKWMEIRPDVGEYIGVLDWKFDVTASKVTIVANVDYSLRDADFTVIYLNNGMVESAAFAVKYTFAEQFQKGVEQLPRAGLNTVIGMGVVFAVLILISLIIGCFKYINKFEQSIKNKKESKTAVAVEAVDNTIAQIVQKEEGVELVDDLELVAVIAAAIAAHTGTSTDGFVVRSIKKSNKNKWRNA